MQGSGLCGLGSTPSTPNGPIVKRYYAAFALPRSEFDSRWVHMSTKGVGDFGERIAEKYLKDKGYQILDKNYSFRIPGNPQKGEIDIVAKKI